MQGLHRAVSTLWTEGHRSGDVGRGAAASRIPLGPEACGAQRAEVWGLQRVWVRMCQVGGGGVPEEWPLRRVLCGCFKRQSQQRPGMITAAQRTNHSQKGSSPEPIRVGVELGHRRGPWEGL